MGCRLSPCLLIHTSAFALLPCSASVAKVIVHSRPAIDPPNKHFSLTVADVAVDCIETVVQVGYAHFSFSGKVRIDLTTSEPIDHYDLSPHRLKIRAETSGNHLRFWVDRPCKLHLRINQLPRFFIFADRLEVPTPDVASRNTYLLTAADAQRKEKMALNPEPSPD